MLGKALVKTIRAQFQVGSFFSGFSSLVGKVVFSQTRLYSVTAECVDLRGWCLGSDPGSAANNCGI